MRSAGLIGLLILVATLVVLPAQPARADAMSQLYRQILRDPQNIELNLKYAQLAEERGQIRKALAAYERVLDAEPENAEARRGLRRITANLHPTITGGQLELGVRYESNVLERPSNTDDDIIGFAKLYVADERGAHGQIWRSDLYGYADVHGDTSSLDYWRGLVHTGPVFDLGGGTTVHVAPGGGVAFLDADYFYSEAALRLVFEQLFGFLDRFTISGGYRDIGNSFSRDSGVVFDAAAQEAFRGVLTEADAFVVQPFVRLRDAAGDATNVVGVPTSFLMGDYVEVGGRVMYFIYLEDDIRLGGRFTGWYRDYQQNITAGTTERYDFFIAPEAEVLFRSVVCAQCDIRLRYRFEQNFSNDATQDFTNHSIIASGIRRF